MHRNSETALLRRLIPVLAIDFGPRGVERVSKRDVVGGWDEMQGYPEGAYGDTVGLSWGDLGNAANIAFNPVAQYHALQRAFGNGPPAGSQVRQFQQAPQQQMPQRIPTAPMLPPNAYQALQGGPRRLLSYMGLGSFAWQSTTTTGLETLLTAEPQAAFRGRRLVVSQAKTDGAAGVLVTITSPLTVSGMPQTPAPNQAAPAEMFASDTTYSMLDLQIATSATQITLGVSVSALPATGETVTVAAGLYGEWLR